MTEPWTELVGAAHVRAGGMPDAVDGIVPAWVVHPASVAEVQACVRTAARAGAALVASGGGAHLDIGAPPTRLDVLLRLDRLARILDHQAADMTVTVEAGCPLAVLADRLAGAGQWLPLDPPRPEATTVGGLVAANLSGPLRASQGTVRDLLLGIRVVGADGAVVASGGKVVKNVAGYDLPKLHVGALGTVGVIVEATFKVRPRPEREAAVVIACATPATAAALAGEVLDGPVPPLWLEIAGALGDRPALVVGLGGIEEEVAYGAAVVGALAAQHCCEAQPVADGAALRECLAGFPVAPAAAVLRAATLRARVGQMMDAVTSAARGAGATVRMLVHAANGVVRVAVDEPGSVAALVHALRPVLAAGGGSLVVERAVPEVKATVDVWGDPGPGLTLMRRLKTSFDPASLFAPGRFVGGL